MAFEANFTFAYLNKDKTLGYERLKNEMKTMLAGISYDDPPANDEEEGRRSDHAVEASTEHSNNENSFVVDCNSFPDKTLNTPNALDDTFGASYDTSKESESVKKKLKRENLLKSIKKSSNNISKYQTDYKYNVDDQNKNVGTEDSMKSKTNTAEEQQNEHNRIMQFFLKRQSGTGSTRLVLVQLGLIWLESVWLGLNRLIFTWTLSRVKPCHSTLCFIYTDYFIVKHFLFFSHPIAKFIPYDVEKQVTSDNFVIPTSTIKNIPSSFHFPINQIDDFNNSKFVISYSRDNNGHKRRDKGQAVNYWDAFRSHADELRYHMQPLPFFRIG
ncbi:hypothetical protein HELRODRAFT_162855 [Helobdella robusta]|uniref:Uncharacterized protein n=1 Tax=Helobdella robusta TaxID=6412 RepID=T1ETA3_HELRO|nr:hypothetical protein HELRODRAFT_162855 [Helobdella robusta]ESN99332.1 hypothetical protein HELRODRAFT_162855 [Helobdella robusta]